MVSTNISDSYKTSLTFNLTFPLYENRKSYTRNIVKKAEKKIIAPNEKSQKKTDSSNNY